MIIAIKSFVVCLNKKILEIPKQCFCKTLGEFPIASLFTHPYSLNLFYNIAPTINA